MVRPSIFSLETVTVATRETSCADGVKILGLRGCNLQFGSGSMFPVRVGVTEVKVKLAKLEKVFACCGILLNFVLIMRERGFLAPWGEKGKFQAPAITSCQLLRDKRQISLW